MRVITRDDALIGGRAAAAVTLRPADVTPCSAWTTSLIFFMVIQYFLHFHHHIAIAIISTFIDSLTRPIFFTFIIIITIILRRYAQYLHLHYQSQNYPHSHHHFLTFILIHLYSHFRHLPHFRPILAIFSLITIPSVAVPSNTFPTSSSAVVFPFITIFYYRHPWSLSSPYM